LNVANGNYSNVTDFKTTGNPNLSCIQVDDVPYSIANWTDIDDTTSFATDCCIVDIPDTNFEIALLQNTGINVNGDDKISCSEAAAFTGTINVSNQGIDNLTGIEAFVNLTRLYCANNNLTHLDVSNNTALTSLTCSTNALTSLDVSNNTELVYFICHSNTITDLDLSLNTNLMVVSCENNALANLNMTNGNNTGITVFNAENNPNLTCIYVDNPDYSTANWTNIDSTANFIPTGFVNIPNAYFKAYLLNKSIINTNGDDEIDYCEAAAFTGEIRFLYDDQVTDLTGIEAFVNLTVLDCHGTNLTSLNISKNTALTYLDLLSNHLTSLDVSKNIALTDLYCDFNELQSLDITNNTALTFLICNGNYLTNLDLSNNLALTDLWCHDNNLISLDLSNNLDLKELWCNDNNITSLDLSNQNSLTFLNSNSNNLTYLNVANGNNMNFTTISTLPVFNAINNPNLRCIYVDDADYSTTNWTNIDDTSYFVQEGVVNIPDANFKAALVNNPTINTNNDTEIDYCEAASYDGLISVVFSSISDLTGIEAFINITGLFCDHNNLTRLDLSKNTALTSISCFNNPLMTELNVANGNNTSITLFNALINPDLTCIQVDNATYSTNNWTFIDPTASFSTDCGYTSIPTNISSTSITSISSKTNTKTTTNTSGSTTLLNTNAVKVSPNPVAHSFNVTTPSGFTLKSVKVYNLLGHVILSSANHQVDASNLPSGTYVVKIESTDGQITTKSIIKR